MRTSAQARLLMRKPELLEGKRMETWEEDGSRGADEFASLRRVSSKTQETEIC